MNPIKNFIKHYWFSFRDLTISNYTSKTLEKSLVILRVDAIGDYILFRNFLEIIKKSEKYQDYHITLIGNNIWRPIAENLDNEWIDRFIWVNLKSFHKDLSYRKESLKEIEDTSYTVLFHPTYSRDYYISEVIANHINANYKVASVGDLSNTTKWQKKISDKKYDQLIPLDETTIFEFEKNRSTLSQFIEEECAISKPTIDRKLLSDSKFIFENYIILFIGGSTRFKKWDLEKWISICKNLLAQFNHTIILSGAPDDFSDSVKIMAAFIDNNRVVNLCGKTSVFELMELISKSSLLISNETSAPHMAVALDIPVIVIANGSHYGRFTPYPKNYISNYSVVLPKRIDLKLELIDLAVLYSKESFFSINSITEEEVYSVAKDLLS